MIQFIAIVEIKTEDPVSPLEQLEIVFVDPDVDLLAIRDRFDPEIFDLAPEIAIRMSWIDESDRFLIQDDFTRIGASDESLKDDVATDHDHRKIHRVCGFQQHPDPIKQKKDGKITNAGYSYAVAVLIIDICLIHRLKRRRDIFQCPFSD